MVQICVTSGTSGYTFIGPEGGKVESAAFRLDENSRIFLGIPLKHICTLELIDNSQICILKRLLVKNTYEMLHIKFSEYMSPHTIYVIIEIIGKTYWP